MLRHLKCPSCGAPVDVDVDHGRVACDYCGTGFLVEKAEERPAPPPAQANPDVSGMAVLSAVVALVLLVSFGVVGAVLGSGSSAGLEVLPGALGGEHLQWDATTLPVVVAAPERVVGRYRVLRDGDSDVHLGAWDAATLERVWHTEALGTWSESAYMHVMVEAVGDRVVHTDAWTGLVVRDAATGEELARHALADRAVSSCRVPGTDRVWIEVANEQHVALDVATGQFGPEARPEGCPDLRMDPFQGCRFGSFHRYRPRAACEDGPDGVREGMKVEAELLAPDGARFAIGARAPGTATPLVARVGAWKREATDAEPRLVAEDPPLAFDLVGGDPILLVEMRDGTARLVRLDGATGATRYDVAVPRSGDGSGPDGYTISDTRVYVPHWTWLDVFDLETGAHQGTVGRW